MIPASVPGVSHDPPQDARIFVAPGSSGSSRQRGSGDVEDVERARRKRRLDLDIEASQRKLRLIEMERKRLELDEPGSLGVAHSSSADFAHYSRASLPSPRVNSTPINEDDIVQRLSRAFSTALNESRASDSQVSLFNRLVSHKVSLSFSGDPLDYLRFKRAFSESTALGGCGCTIV